MRVDVLGRRWQLEFTPNLVDRGDCDPPDQRGKLIRVRSTLAGEERLEIVLHELLHAAAWHIDEEFVERFAADAARALWRLGYRDAGGTAA